MLGRLDNGSKVELGGSRRIKRVQIRDPFIFTSIVCLLFSSHVLFSVPLFLLFLLRNRAITERVNVKNTHIRFMLPVIIMFIIDVLSSLLSAQSETADMMANITRLTTTLSDVLSLLSALHVPPHVASCLVSAQGIRFH